jgi:hypothetical protein
MLSVIKLVFIMHHAECFYIECCYAGFHYAECLGLLFLFFLFLKHFFIHLLNYSFDFCLLMLFWINVFWICARNHTRSYQGTLTEGEGSLQLIKVTCFVKKGNRYFQDKNELIQTSNNKEINCTEPSLSVRVP